MRVGILGSGLMGGRLGTLFARAGHEVVFSYARSEKKLEKLARDARRNARVGALSDLRDIERAASKITVPGARHPDHPESLTGR